MKKLLLVLSVAMMLMLPASAHAVSYSYCDYSLRGGGTLAPDDDIRAAWTSFQNAGYNITSSYASQWFGGDGASSVSARWIFWRANGQYFTVYFSCYGSGASYHDERSLG